MKKSYSKLQHRAVRSTLARFLSILGIVVIGAGFLAGLLATAPDMKLTVDQYFEETSLMDVDVKGTLGLTEEDIKTLHAFDGVKTVMPAYVTDVILTGSDGTDYVSRLYGVPLALRGTEAFLNDFVLVEGRMPEAPDEVLLLSRNAYTQHHSVGEAYTISKATPDYDDRADTYSVERFTVTGLVRSPYYMTVETEPSGVGAGNVELVFFAGEACYALDVYTDAFLALRQTDGMDAFSKAYENLLDDMADALDPIGAERSTLRYVEVKEEAQQEIDDAQAELDEARADAEEDLADARKKLDDAHVELGDAKEDFAEGEAKFNYAKGKYYQGKADFFTEIADARRDLAAVAGGLPDYMVKAMTESIDDAEQSGSHALGSARKKLYEGEEELEEGRIKISEAEFKLNNAEIDYAEAKLDAETQIADAQQKLDDAQRELDDLDEPEWIVLDRTDLVSYASYKSNTEKIDAIARVFPIFLFLVAALVALTTMTRMVEEERTQIGVLKALGYRDRRILLYYLGYSLWASLLGCIIGIIGGFKVLPAVISRAYNMMYTLPPIVTAFRWNEALTIAPVAVLCTTLATLAACLSQLKEKPSLLMLPRVPEEGKRILLERVPFIWNRLKFTQKVTCRNIFRYKKRLYMTVFGIAGCTALLLTGFGLRDSINDIVDKQFLELYQYDMTISLKNDEALNENETLRAYLDDPQRIASYTEVHNEGATVTTPNGSESTTIYVPKQPERLKEHIVLRERVSGNDVPFDENSVVLTEKMCEQLGLRIGDSFTLIPDDGGEAQLKVTGITENYVASYVFISQSAYTSAFHMPPEYNKVIAKAASNDEAAHNAIAKELLSDDDVSLVSFNSSIKDSFDNLIGNINYIIYVLIISAGALAVIVLYNLTNINISERKKELATIKVLGFYEREVAGYIYRETTVLSIFGALAGFVFGKWLHAFVIQTAEVEAVMFGRTLYFRSYLIAAAVTLLFTFLVELLMLPKIRRISMVESMKAND